MAAALMRLSKTVPGQFSFVMIKKKQLGGVQTTMEAALETAIVKETENNDPVEEVSPPVTPWAVSPSFYYGW